MTNQSDGTESNQDAVLDLREPLEVKHQRIQPYPYIAAEGFILSLLAGPSSKASITFYQDVVHVESERLEPAGDGKFFVRAKKAPFKTEVVRLDVGTVLLSEAELISLRDTISRQLDLLAKAKSEMEGNVNG